MSAMQFTMNVLLSKENDQWVAQCLQYDVVGQGDSIDDALFGLEACVVAHLTLDLEAHRAPLEWIPKAPKSCWDRYERAKELKEQYAPRLFDGVPEELLKDVPPAFMLPKPDHYQVRVV